MRLVKIGISTDVTKRIQQIACGVPFDVRLHAIIGGGPETETEFKKQFRDLRVKGEWFRPDASINAWLSEKHAAAKLLRQLPTDAAFIEKYLLPLGLNYLAGREPANTPGGDLMVRMLAGKLASTERREDELNIMASGAISLEMAHGYIPDLSDDAAIPIVIPTLSVVTAASDPTPHQARGTA